MAEKLPLEIQIKCKKLHEKFDDLAEEVQNEAIMVNVMAAYISEAIISQEDPLKSFVEFVATLGNYTEALYKDMSNDVENDPEFD